MKKVAITLGILISAYVAAYAVAYANRGPAANLAYFSYTETGNHEEIVYRFFYPVYFVHFRMLGGEKHYLDPHVLYPREILDEPTTQTTEAEPSDADNSAICHVPCLRTARASSLRV